MEQKDTSKFSCNLESSEQAVLQQAREILGSYGASEFKLPFLARRVLEKSPLAGKRKYATAYEAVDLTTLPHHANLISSHRLFQLKYDQSRSNLRLECRLVHHGSRDKEKDTVRKHSATAHLPVVRLALFMASILGMRIASTEIRSAYLQAGEFPRDIYMISPKGWASSLRKVWKLLRLAYGIAESGRL